MDVGERLETAVREAPPTSQGEAEAIYVRGRRRARRRKTLVGAAGAVALMGLATLGVQTVEWLRPGEIEVADQPDAPMTDDETDTHKPESGGEPTHPESEELVLEVLEEYGFLPVARSDHGQLTLTHDGNEEHLEDEAGIPLVLHTYKAESDAREAATHAGVEREADRIETTADGWPEGMTVGIMERGGSYVQYIIHAGEGVFVNLVAERKETQALLPDIAATSAQRLETLDELGDRGASSEL